MLRTFFLLFFIFKSFAQETLDNDVITSSTEVVMTVEQILAEMLACQDAQYDAGVPYCDPGFARVNTMIHSYKYNRMSFDQKLVRDIFSLQGHGIQTFPIRPFRANRDRLNIRLTDGYQFNMNMTGAPQMMTIQNREGQTTFSCQVENPDSHLESARLTQNTLNRLSRTQKYKWREFCSNFEEEEKATIEAMENNWKIENEPYLGCPAGLPWKYTIYFGLCLGKNPAINKEILEQFPNFNLPPAFTFLFDGFNAYDTDSALGLAANVTGDENFFRARLRDSDPKRYYQNTHTTAINAYRNTFDNRYINGIPEPQLLYYDGSGFDQSHGDSAASACFQDMQEWIDIAQMISPEVKRPRNIVIGYSNGGAAALRMQQAIGRSGHNTDLLLTVDPIERQGAFFGSRLTGIGMLPSRHENTERHVNLYQNNDIASLNFPMIPIDLRSRELASADENLNLNENVDPFQSHLEVIYHDRTIDRMSCEINQVILDTVELCL